MSLRQKLVVLTGCTRGLGLAMTHGLAKRGHIVYGCGLNTSMLSDLAKEYPGPHNFACVDVTKNDQVKEWAAETLLLSDGRTPDYVINNAAVINPEKPLWEISAKEFDRVMDVNVAGVANVIRHFVPPMVEVNKGVVINFSSTFGRVAASNVGAYSASKWAIEGMTKSLAAELPSNMAAVPVVPGMHINTDMLRVNADAHDLADHFQAPEDWAEQAIPFLLGLSVRDSGISLQVPSFYG